MKHFVQLFFSFTGKVNIISSNYALRELENLAALWGYLHESVGCTVGHLQLSEEEMTNARQITHGG